MKRFQCMDMDTSYSASKRPRCEEALKDQSHGILVLDKADWTQLVDIYRMHDETRETVIKRCRDMQVTFEIGGSNTGNKAVLVEMI